MFFYSEEYKSNIAKAWHSFVEASSLGKEMDPELKACVRPEIFDGWVRSRNANANPYAFKEEKIAGAELEAILIENASLISASREYIESLYIFLSGFNFVVMLTDRRGIVLYVKNEDSITKKLTDGHLLDLGSIRSDEYAGSNAMGTCLYLGKPIQYWGEEHYATFNHPFICSAAPIRDPKGNIIGSIDITGPKEELNNIALSIVVSAASGIEKNIRLQEESHQISILNNQLTTLLQQMPYGIISVSKDGTITQFNNKALNLLRLNAEDMHMQKIYSLVKHSTEENPFTDLCTQIQNKPLEFETKLDMKLSLSMSTTNIHDDKGEIVGVLILLQELQAMHTMISRMSGFTAKYTFDSIIGNSPLIYHAKHTAKLAAKGDSNVLITGESGTGKELFAQAIHNASTRASKPFIAINCGGIPQSLIESELFGYDKGAFTGANKDGSPGKFELAEGGTIFLDEIGNMALDAQAALLRVIQTKEIMRIGSNKMKKVDVRIIAATNVDLEKSAEDKSFRSDLYYRLNVITIELPSLMEHPEDIAPLVNHFIRSHVLRKHSNITGMFPEAFTALENYNWPGNTRELENVIERAINLCETSMIGLIDLPKKITSFVSKTSTQETYTTSQNSFAVSSASGSEILDDFSKKLVEESLMKTNGNVTEAAALLKISRRTLHYKIKRYELNVNAYRR